MSKADELKLNARELQLKMLFDKQEKKIAELIEQNTSLLTSVENLNKSVQELEAQIEKMKRYLDCEYCEHYTQPYGCKNCNEEIRSDWKLKEIKEK